MGVVDKLRETFRPRQRLTVEEYAAKLMRKGLNADGSPILDPVPMAPPIGYKKVPSMVEIVRDMVRSERLAQEARDAGHETFEEAEDFDIGEDDPQLHSPFENDFDPPLEELLEAGRRALAEKSGGVGGSPPTGAAAAAVPEAPEAPPKAP